MHSTDIVDRHNPRFGTRVSVYRVRRAQSTAELVTLMTEMMTAAWLVTAARAMR